MTAVVLFERRVVSLFGMASGGKVLNGGGWSTIGGWLSVLYMVGGGGWQGG